VAGRGDGVPLDAGKRLFLASVRVRSRVDFLELGDADLGVDLRGVEPRVAEQLLDGADVRAVVVHVGGAAVAEGIDTLLINSARLGSNTDFTRSMGAKCR